MDVAPRQSFIAGIVLPTERTVTLGLVNVVKSLAASFGPLATGKPFSSWPTDCTRLRVQVVLTLTRFAYSMVYSFGMYCSLNQVCRAVV